MIDVIFTKMTNIPLFSQYELNFREEGAQLQIYDPFRKLWLVDTPEERVRQGMLLHIHHERNVASGLIAIEREIEYHQVKKRFDAVVFDGDGKPWIVCECKAPSVKITQEVLYQIGRYNAVLKAPHLLVTNGVQWLFFSINENGSFAYVPEGWVMK